MSGELHPLPNGIVLIAGIRASTLSDEIRNHPRVRIWDDQHEHWYNKDVPANAKAIFFGRWIAHSAFHNIVKQAKKRGITLFNTEGANAINRQVKELLAMPAPVSVNEEPKAVQTFTVELPETQAEVTKMNERPMPKNKQFGKLDPLKPFIEVGKGDADNARVLYEKAQELGITTTFLSLTMLVRKIRLQREGKTIPVYPKRSRVAKKHGPRVVQADGSKELDVAVAVLDSAIKELTDVRAFLVQTVAENNKLKARFKKFREMFE